VQPHFLFITHTRHRARCAAAILFRGVEEKIFIFFLKIISTETMTRILPIILSLLVLFFPESATFSITKQNSPKVLLARRSLNKKCRQSILFSPRHASDGSVVSSQLTMMADDSSDGKKKKTTVKKSSVNSFPSNGYLEALDEDNKKAVGAGGGKIATLLLAIPLLCKFFLVLGIKFLTDLVVFPLLFLYRMARVGKKKVLSLFAKSTLDKSINGQLPNGEKSS